MSTPVETTWQQKRGRLARLSQDLPPDHPELVALREAMHAQKTVARVEKIIRDARLSDEQRAQLAKLFQGGAR